MNALQRQLLVTVLDFLFFCFIILNFYSQFHLFCMSFVVQGAPVNFVNKRICMYQTNVCLPTRLFYVEQFACTVMWYGVIAAAVWSAVPSTQHTKACKSFLVSFYCQHVAYEAVLCNRQLFEYVMICGSVCWGLHIRIYVIINLTSMYRCWCAYAGHSVQLHLCAE